MSYVRDRAESRKDTCSHKMRSYLVLLEDSEEYRVILPVTCGIVNKTCSQFLHMAVNLCIKKVQLMWLWLLVKYPQYLWMWIWGRTALDLGHSKESPRECESTWWSHEGEAEEVVCCSSSARPPHPDLKKKQNKQMNRWFWCGQQAYHINPLIKYLLSRFLEFVTLGGK